MNDTLSAMSDGLTGERPGQEDERPASGGGSLDVPAFSAADALVPVAAAKRDALFLRRTAIVVILLFFTTQFATMTLTRHVRFPDESWGWIFPRAIVNALGLLFSLLILKVQWGARRGPLRRRIWIAAGMAAAGSSVHGAANVLVFAVYLGDAGGEFLQRTAYIPISALEWLWFYSAISVMLLALTYAADLAESDDRIAALQSQAHAAQMRALRYQLNPHFLFNTLNSIAALIGRRKSRDAESMVVSLSDFLRSTLSMDAGKEISLGDEVKLQSLYLDIERTRFPVRLCVTIDIPEDLRDALVPNLITQPLIENAIKYGVARSSEPVHLEVIARAEQGRLSLQIRDDGGNAPDATPQGMRVGLRNVSDRLKIHFGDQASLVAGRLPEGGFSAQILMPLKRA
jgi:two-component system LytT family sensor kinase